MGCLIYIFMIYIYSNVHAKQIYRLCIGQNASYLFIRKTHFLIPIHKDSYFFFHFFIVAFQFGTILKK